MKFDLSLYIITDRRAAGGRDLLGIVEASIKNGATLVQLREKILPTGEFVSFGTKLHAITSNYNVPLIVNDRIDVALAINAEGVHVGQDDMPAELVRKLIGPDKIIGVSTHSVEQAKKAEKDGADYIGVGPVFATQTKPDAEPIGLKTLQDIAATVKLPKVGIGAVTRNNAQQVLDAGADGIAVISAIIGADDVAGATKELRKYTL